MFKSKRRGGCVDWIKVAEYVGTGRTGRVVASRFRCNLDPNLQGFTRTKVTPEEVSNIYHFVYECNI